MFNTGTLAQVASVISDEYGVRVRVSGSEACTGRDSTTKKWVITVPAINVNEKYVDTMRGYIDHEAGHVRFSDMDVLVQTMTNEPWFVRSALNIFEDVYVEKKMSRNFPGCARNLRVAADILFAHDYQVPEDVVEAMLDYLLFKARYDVHRAAVFESHVRQLNAALPPEVKSIADEALRKLRTCSMNTKENCKLAKDLYADLCDLLERLNKENEVQKDAPVPGGDGNGGGSNGYGDSDDNMEGESGSGDADGESAESGGNPDSDGQDVWSDDDDAEQNDEQEHEQEDGEEQQQDDEEEQKPKEEQQPQDDDDADGLSDDMPSGGDTSSKGDSTGDDEDGSGHGGGAGNGDVDLDKLAEMIASLTHMKRDEDGADHQSYDMSKRINERMSEITEQSDADVEYRGYYSRTPNEMDIDNPHIMKAMLSELEDYQGPLKESAKLSSQLAGLLQTVVMNRGGFATRGRIDPRRLARLAVGRSDVFSSRVEKNGIDTEVIIAVDGSGSMGGSKEECASKALYAVIRALKLIPGVRSMAFLYSGRRINHIVGFDQAFSNKIPFRISSNGGTPTGEAVYHAIGKFSRDMKRRRILIIMTDGEPDDTTYFRTSIKTAKRLGIETIGIGIEDDYLTRDMSPEDSFVIQRLDELTPLLFSLLRNKLVKRS